MAGYIKIYKSYNWLAQTLEDDGNLIFKGNYTAVRGFRNLISLAGSSKLGREARHLNKLRYELSYSANQQEHGRLYHLYPTSYHYVRL